MTAQEISCSRQSDSRELQDMDFSPLCNVASTICGIPETHYIHKTKTENSVNDCVNNTIKSY